MVSTRPALDVQYTSAVLVGHSDIQDIQSVEECGFLLSKTNDFITTTKVVAPFNYININHKVSGLESNQTYFYNFYVDYADGSREEGNVQSFQTLVISGGDLETRPHIMLWVTNSQSGGTDNETGYPLPDIPGQAIETPCRFHLGGTKVFKNEDSTEVNQIGTIRLDAGNSLPTPGSQINVVGHFSGIVRSVYKGQLTHRIDV